MRIKNTLIIFVVCLFCAELGLRLFFAYRVGAEYLFYGTKWSRSGFGGTREWVQHIEKTQSLPGHPNIVLRYCKYFPNQERFEHHSVTNKIYCVTINSKGFRGKEFKQEKGSDVLRIVTLGASSTFGFGDGDTETYPHILEEILRKEIQQHPFDARIRNVEVINLGIPHLTSDQIFSLFVNEALPLNPDIVTFYEGINDAEKGIEIFPGQINPAEDSITRSILKAAKDHLLVFLVPWAQIRTSATHSAEYLDHFISGKSEFLIGNLKKIQELCSDRSITFFIITQQARSMSVESKGLTYKEEVTLIEQKLKRQKGTNNDIWFLTHNRMMDDLRTWAKEHHVLLIEGCGALDSNRECVYSWVHLTPEGNRILAEKIAGDILTQLHKVDHKQSLSPPVSVNKNPLPVGAH